MRALPRPIRHLGVHSHRTWCYPSRLERWNTRWPPHTRSECGSLHWSSPTAAYGLHWGSERMMLSVPHPTAAAVSCWSMSSRTMDSSLKQPQLAATRRSAHLDAARGDRHERTSTSVWQRKGCMGVGSGWRPLGEWPRRSGRPPASMRSNSSSTSGCSVCTTTTVGINHEPDVALARSTDERGRATTILSQ